MNYFKFGKSSARKAAQKRIRNQKSSSWKRELTKAKEEIKEGTKIV